MKFTKENVEKVIDEYFWQADLESCGDLIAEIHNLDDTPEKVVVPEFVAEFYEECANATLEFLITQLEAAYSRSELGEWYRSCSGRHRNGRANAQEVIAKMKLYGYEVEREPLYEVLLPYVMWSDKRSELVTDYQKLMFDKTSEETRFVCREYIPIHDDYTCKLTELDIREIDERYWPFAVLAND